MQEPTANAGGEARWADVRFIDLTLPFGEATASPPSVGISPVLTRYHRGPGFWQVSRIDMVLHTGSHVDFARHCRKDGETAEMVDLGRVSGRPVVIDLGKCPARHEITVADLEAHAPPLGPDAVALVRTGWSDEMWGRFPDYYVDSPYCSPEAVEWIVDRGVKAVGFDCFSEFAARLPDFTSEDFVVHRTVLDAGAILLQQMTNLAAIPDGDDVLFVAAFPRIVDAEGAPARFFVIAA